MVDSGPSIQQIHNRPCLIGDPSCHNPSDFGFTLIPPHDGSDTLRSPTYTVQQIRNLVGKEGSEVNVQWRDENGAKVATHVDVTQVSAAKNKSRAGKGKTKGNY